MYPVNEYVFAARWFPVKPPNHAEHISMFFKVGKHSWVLGHVAQKQFEGPPMFLFSCVQSCAKLGGPGYPILEDTCTRSPILLMDEILHHLETMVETIVCWYLQGNHQKPGLLWCELDFATIHSCVLKWGVGRHILREAPNRRRPNNPRELGCLGSF